MTLKHRLEKLESAAPVFDASEPLTMEQIRALSDDELLRLIFIENNRPRPFMTPEQIREEKREIERLKALPDDELERLLVEKLGDFTHTPNLWK